MEDRHYSALEAEPCEKTLVGAITPLLGIWSCEGKGMVQVDYGVAAIYQKSTHDDACNAFATRSCQA
jgi:hypothetical protein